MIEGAIFDCDGTLFDSMYLYRGFVTRYLAGRGITADEDVESAIRYMSFPEAAEYVRVRYHLPDTAEEIVADCNRILEQAYYQKIELRPGVRELLEALHAKGVPMCIATNTERYLIRAALSRVGIDHYFCGIATCAEAGAGKEQPLVYEAALRLIGTPVPTTWVFEDARHAVRTAKAYGFPVCAVRDPDETDHAEEIRETSDIYLDSFAGFSTDRLER